MLVNGRLIHGIFGVRSALGKHAAAGNAGCVRHYNPGAAGALFLWGCRAHHSPMPKRPRHDWSRPLLRPLSIPMVMQLETLADVRTLIDKHLPAQLRAKPHWRYVTGQLKEAAEGADTADVAAALVIALALEGVKCRS
jgi:hypothetical protein